jgi:hypothetical protein
VESGHARVRRTATRNDSTRGSSDSRSARGRGRPHAGFTLGIRFSFALLYSAIRTRSYPELGAKGAVEVGDVSKATSQSDV